MTFEQIRAWVVQVDRDSQELHDLMQLATHEITGQQRRRMDELTHSLAHRDQRGMAYLRVLIALYETEIARLRTVEGAYAAWWKASREDDA